MANSRDLATTQDANHGNTDNFVQNLTAMPGELVNMITAMVMEVSWPSDNSERFMLGESPLQVDLVKAENPQLRAAVKDALSKKVFVNFTLWMCSSPPKTRTGTLYHLPRVMSEEDYRNLQQLPDLPPSTIDITFHFGCPCKNLRRAYSTVFLLDKLTTLMFMYTFREKNLFSWQRADIICRIQKPSAATVSREFLDIALKTIPARGFPNVTLSGHPDIIDPITWVSNRLVISPINSEKVIQNELQLRLIEEISEHGLFMHLFWLRTVHVVIEESLKRCLSCQLDMHERNNFGRDPLLQILLPDMERLLRIRLRACLLYFRGLMNCLEKGNSINLYTRFIATYSDGHRHCLLRGRRNPYAAERNDLARCIWIVDSFCAEIMRIPYLHDQLLHLIYTAVLHRAFVMMKLAQACARNPNLHYRQPLKVGDLWFEDANGDPTPDADRIMESQHFMEAVDRDLEWLRDHRHLSLQTNEDSIKWKDRFLQANGEYTRITQAEN